MAFKIIDTKFIGGYNFLKDLPKDYPQIALLGRSNAGKSTLVNRLCNRKSLAKTSKTPGRTQEFNFFEVTYKANDELKKFHLVDLPGFGFAKFSKVKQNALSKNIVNYLTSDLPLLGILLLNDSRRTPKEDEFAIQKLCFNYNNIRFITKETDINISNVQAYNNCSTTGKGTTHEEFVYLDNIRVY